jgi:meso-butanediol dehydrogenase / (S,S)-butanediol dehydrogenase / diacetyl reductase
MKLEGKVALVTGAGRGIGQGIAGCLAREGASVVVADVNGESAQATAKALADAGHKAVAVTADVTKSDQVRAMVQKAVDHFGKLDIAVNNAGIVGAKELAVLPEEEWDRVMEVNVKSVFLCCKAQAPLMAENGGGTIVNVASVAGKIGFPGLSHYCASKYAVVGFTNAIAKEYARRKVTINAICPGLVGTDMWKGTAGLANLWKTEGETVEEAWNRLVTTLVPQGEAQTAEDMGETVVFLATAPHIVGQSINIDGGYASH